MIFNKLKKINKPLNHNKTTLNKINNFYQNDKFFYFNHFFFNKQFIINANTTTHNTQTHLIYFISIFNPFFNNYILNKNILSEITQKEGRSYGMIFPMSLIPSDFTNAYCLRPIYPKRYDLNYGRFFYIQKSLLNKNIFNLTQKYGFYLGSDEYKQTLIYSSWYLLTTSKNLITQINFNEFFFFCNRITLPLHIDRIQYFKSIWNFIFSDFYVKINFINLLAEYKTKLKN